MGGEKQNTGARQEQIVRAALHIIAGEGTGSLSVARISQEIGLVPSAIYRHFNGKNEVIDAVLERVRQLLLANVAMVKAETDNPLAALRLLMNRHLNLLCENDGISTLIFSDQVYSGPAKRKGRIYAIIQAYLAAIGQLVQEGKRSRSIGDQIDRDTAAVLFLGLVQPPAILWHLSDGRFNAQKQAACAWTLFEKAIAPDKIFERGVNRHSHSLEPRKEL